MTLEILTSDALAPLRHGFFTRRGGASSGVFAGLNCGRGSSDQTEAVEINRARVAEAMQLGPGDLITLKQVHSADVQVIGPTGDPEGARADAMVTAQPGLGLAILTADCQPVLLADHRAGVIGAAHAGWKGALGGILERTLDEMTKLGATPETTVAVIGPSISQDNYEVGPELAARFAEADIGARRYFTPGKGDRLQFDLTGYGLSRLRRAGVGQAHWTGHCTYGDAGRFYSYRRSVHLNEVDYGRLIAVIRL